MSQTTATLLFLHGECLLRIPADALLPRFGGLLLARHLPLAAGDRILDLGCGAGLVGITAARRGHQVVAADVLELCCRVTRSNALLNGVRDRVETRQGDLFRPVAGERFALIAANPPQMPTPPDREWPDDTTSQMHDGGPDGWSLLARIIREAPAHLAPGGRLAVTLFGFLGVERALAQFRAAGLAPRILAREIQPFPRLARERLEHIRRLDGDGTLPAGRPAVCSRYVICGEKA